MSKLLLLLITLTSFGCVHLVTPDEDAWSQSGGLPKSATPHSMAVSTLTVTTMTPKFDTVHIEASFVESKLLIAGTKEQSCRHDVVVNYENSELVEYELPGWHWAVFGIGVALVGTGTYLVVDGANRIDSGPGLGTLSEEKSQDAGYYMFDAGLAVLPLGGLLLLSELGDVLLAGDEVMRRPNTEEVVESRSEVCGRVSVDEGFRVAIKASDEFKIEMDMDSDGKASASTIAWSRFPVGATSLVLSCDQCEPISIEVPSNVTAAMVLSQGDLSACDDWMATHSEDDPNWDAIHEAREALLEKQRQKEQLAVQLIGQAKGKLEKGALEEARVLVDECLTLSTSRPVCEPMALDVRHAEAKVLANEAEAAIKAGELERADTLVRECREAAGSAWSEDKSEAGEKLRTRCDQIRSQVNDVRAKNAKKIEEAIEAERRQIDAEKADISTYCDAEWPSDYEMKNYCTEQQFMARSKVKNGTQDAIAKRCVKEWTNGFTNWNMAEYCIKTQRDAKSDGGW